ncbi:MAG: hypothetical protein WKF85_12325 [Chitinophagaceae bacterium]
MKNFIVAICIGAIIIFFESCKNDIPKSDINNSSIISTWELRRTQGGMSPVKDYPPGNGTILKFSDSSYERYENGSLIKSGYYKLIRDTSVGMEVGLVIPSGQFTNKIVYDSDSASRKTFIEVSINKLTFLSGFFPSDGGSDVSYERIIKKH